MLEKAESGQEDRSSKIRQGNTSTTEVVRPCEENERGAHSEKNARCGHTREKKKMTDKRKMEICMYDRYDKGRVERGQRNNVDNR